MDNIEDIRQEIIRFKNDPVTQQLQTRYKSKSMPEIMGFNRKELAHSNFIAWLFSVEDHGELAKFNLLKFLEILSMRGKPSIGGDQSYIFDSVISDDLNIKDIEIFSEKSIGSAGRIDIFISFKYEKDREFKTANIIVENKVTSAETGDQTNRYFEYFENKKSRNCNIYVYLTPLPTLELLDLTEPECLNKHFLQINYQSLVDYLLEPLLRQSIAPHIEKAIQDYLLALSQPTLSGEYNVKEIVMAIGEKERDLLTRFWKNHQTLLYAALDAIASDPDTN